jgi:multidrug efflux pump subunit AcrB
LVKLEEYDVAQNATPKTVAELNDLPIKQVGNSTIYLRDVAQVSDGFAPQTNIVRHDGTRGVLMTVLKTGSASTLAQSVHPAPADVRVRV